jgi:hypothetical protein
MNPTDNVIQAISNQNTKNVARYYATCEGQDPLYVYLNTAYNAFAKLNTSLPSIYDYCPDNAYLDDMISSAHVMLKSLDIIKSASNCAGVQSHWANVFETGTCNDGFQGLFIIWLVQFIMVLFLFLLTSTVSVLYQYFGLMWTVDKDEILAATLEENDPFKPSSMRGGGGGGGGGGGHSVVSANSSVVSNSNNNEFDTLVLNTAGGRGNAKEESIIRAKNKKKGGSGRIPIIDNTYNPIYKPFDLESNKPNKTTNFADMSTM